MPSGNPVLLAPSMQGEVFIDQISGDIYMYDQANKLFISMGNIDQDTAADLQQYVKDKDKQCLKVTASSWAYGMLTNSPTLNTE